MGIRRTLSQRSLGLALVVALTILASPQVGHAAPPPAPNTLCTWVGLNPNLNDPTNWSGCLGFVPLDDDDVVFPNTATTKLNLNNNLPVGRRFRTMTFSDNYSITAGNAVVIGVNGIQVTTGATTISVPLTLAASISLTVAAGSTLTLAGAVGETGGSRTLSTSGLGAVVFGGVNSYTGATSFGAASNRVNGSSASSSGATVQAGATLGGTGVVAATTALANGVVAPGLSPGILTAASASFSAGSRLVVELAGLTPGNLANNHDQLVTNGAVTLNNATLDIALSFAPPPGTVFTIILNNGVGPVTGQFSGVPEGAIVTDNLTGTGASLRVSYLGPNGQGNDVTLTVQGAPGTATPTPVIPEASPLWLFATGALALGWLAARRRR